MSTIEHELSRLQAQIVAPPLVAWTESQLSRIEYISRELMLTVAFMSGFSTRTADELDRIASLFDDEANVLRRRAQQLREKSHAAA